MLVELIHTLSKEEVRHLKLFLKRTNANKKRKDIWLFDQIRKQDNPDEEKLALKLYNNSKNPYYRLKNRLLEDINKSLLTQYYDTNENNSSFQYLLLSRLFFSRSQFKLSYRYLRRAEQITEKSNLNELLDLIYTDFIRLSHETLDLDPEIYIEKRKVLSEKLRKIREIDDLLAVIIYRIKRTQNYGRGNEEILNILQKTVSEYSNDETIYANPALRFKIYHAISRIILQQHDYISLEKYLEETYTMFDQEGLFDKGNHDTRLQMLTYWSNSLFKNNKYTMSLKVAEDLFEEMHKFDSALRDKYYFFYINAQIINYSILEPTKALLKASEALEEDVIQNNPFHKVFILLNQAQLLFDLKAFKKGNRSLIKLKLDDAYDKLDGAFKFKILVAELIFRYEMSDFDSLELLIKSLEKSYGDLLSQEQYLRQKLVIEILQELMITHVPSKVPVLKQKIEQVLNMLGDEEANETDLINYNTWLRPKIGA